MQGIMSSFELKRLSDYTDDEIVAEIRRVASAVPGERITGEEFSRRSRVSKSTLRRHFGGWKQALAAAGLAHRHSGVNLTEKLKSQAAKRMSDSEVLEELRSVAQKIGRDIITVDDFNSHSSIRVDTIRRRFGSWRAGLEMAGLRITHRGRRYTDEECFENLLTVWTHYGRPPQYAGMKLPPSAVGPKAYIVRWKTWNRALHAFVERVNGCSDDTPPGETATPANLKQTSPRPTTPEEDLHKIKLGLRYKILLRDQFKCILCGSSPATNPVCRLHVDHVIPWSKGGKTVAENLRTLCDHCNLGKSDGDEIRVDVSPT
jgi:hypothetical protein